MTTRSTKRPNFNALYRHPLPVRVQVLPPLIPHNPLSWIIYIADYFFPPEIKAIRCRADIQSFGDCDTVKVLNPRDQDILWTMGFFGKGNLSRSEPSWFTRTSRRLNLEGSDKLPLTSEEVTMVRRQERKKFKEERARVEEQELEKVKKMEKGEVVHDFPVDLAPVRPSDSVKVNIEKMRTGMRLEDANIVNDQGELVQQEYMQLMPAEALFLSEALGALEVCDDSGAVLKGAVLFRKLGRADMAQFLHHYVAYHHFRSKGWCVKSGVKFGTDFLLYKRGPPFSHAEFAVIVMPTYADEAKNKALAPEWWWVSSVGRVVGGVKKTLVISYVEAPELSLDDFDLTSLLKSSRVTDIVHRRWLPMRSRD